MITWLFHLLWTELRYHYYFFVSMVSCSVSFNGHDLVLLLFCTKGCNSCGLKLFPLTFLYNFAASMGNVQLLCLMLLQDWHTRMFLHGTVIFAGEFLESKDWNSFFYCFLWPLLDKLLHLSFTISGFVRTYPLFSVETRLMWRTGRLKLSRWHFIGRRTCSTMRYLQGATTISRNLSSTWPGSLQGN